MIRSSLWLIYVLFFLQALSFVLLAAVYFRDPQLVVSADSRGAPVSQPSVRVSCGKTVCEVGFHELQHDSGFYNGRRIRIVGYVAVLNGTILLFPSEHDYRFGNTRLALQLRSKLTRQKEVFDRFSYSYVELTATYEAGNVDAERANYLGILAGPWEALPVRSMESREGWSDVRIHVDDL